MNYSIKKIALFCLSLFFFLFLISNIQVNPVRDSENREEIQARGISNGVNLTSRQAVVANSCQICQASSISTLIPTSTLAPSLCENLCQEKDKKDCDSKTTYVIRWCTDINSNSNGCLEYIYLLCPSGTYCKDGEYVSTPKEKEYIPPEVKDMKVLPETYCISGLPGYGAVTLQWEYQDPDGNPELTFDFQIDDNFDFSSPEVDRTFNVSNFNLNGTINTQTTLVKTLTSSPDCDYINYDTSYYWRARVWDNTGANSNWIEYNDSLDPDNDGNPKTFTKDPNPWPVPEFSFIPANPAPNEKITFTDLSICYDNDNDVYFCKDKAANSYSWKFGDGSNNKAIGNTSHTYNIENTYPVILTVCDGVGCCSVIQNVPVEEKKAEGESLFEWKQISPF